MARSRGGYASRPKQQAPFMLTKLRRRLVHSRRVQTLENIFFCWRQKGWGTAEEYGEAVLGHVATETMSRALQESACPLIPTGWDRGAGGLSLLLCGCIYPLPSKRRTRNRGERKKAREKSHAEDRECEYRSSEITKLPDKKQTEGAKERSEELFVMW